MEYHGEQHLRPVEFFGNEEAFRKNVERDKRKINLAEKNGVKLFVITEDDDPNNLIEDVMNLLKKRKVLPPSLT